MADEQIAALDSLTSADAHPDSVEVTSTVPVVKIDPLTPLDMADPIIAAARAAAPEAKPEDAPAELAPKKAAYQIPRTRAELAARNLVRATQALAEAKREHANAVREENEPSERPPTLAECNKLARKQQSGEDAERRKVRAILDHFGHNRRPHQSHVVNPLIVQKGEAAPE